MEVEDVQVFDFRVPLPSREADFINILYVLTRRPPLETRRDYHNSMIFETESGIDLKLCNQIGVVIGSGTEWFTPEIAGMQNCLPGR